jgi:hypothetical protein
MMGVAVATAALTVQSDAGVQFVSGLPFRRGVTDLAQVVEPYPRGRVELAHEDRRQTPRGYFERGLTVDPTYAPAQAGLADFYRAQAIATDQGSEQARHTGNDMRAKPWRLARTPPKRMLPYYWRHIIISEGCLRNR